MLRLAFKLVFSVLVARWMYAEVQLMTPGAVPYINSAIQSIDIPTHDKWHNTSIGQYLQKQLPNAGAMSRQLTANIELPIKQSAGYLEQAGNALNASRESSGFEKF